MKYKNNCLTFLKNININQSFKIVRSKAITITWIYIPLKYMDPSNSQIDNPQLDQQEAILGTQTANN